VGLDNERFDSQDEAVIAKYLNSVLPPFVEWEKRVIEIEARKLGYLYTPPSQRRPVVCTKNDADLKEADIYFLYCAFR